MKSRSPLILLILAYLLCNEALASNPWQTNQKSQHSDPFALVRKAGKHLLTFPKPGSLSAVSGEMVLENQGNYSQTPSPFYSQTNLTQNNTENSLTPEKHIQIPGSQTVGSIRQISGSQAPRSYHPRQINQKSQYSDTSALGKLKSSLISFPQSGHLSTIKGQVVQQTQTNSSRIPSPFYGLTNLIQNNSTNGMISVNHIQIPGGKIQTAGSKIQTSGSYVQTAGTTRQIPGRHIQTQNNCSNLEYSTGQSTNSSGCKCKQGYVWSGNSCLINCQIIFYASRRSSSNSCHCIHNYLWEDNECKRNCSNIANSPGRSAYDSGACQCDPEYEWNGGSCIKFFDCSTIPNNNENINSTFCQCKNGYDWEKGSCVLNCFNMNNTNGWLNDTACNCRFGYVWSGNSCQLQKIQTPNTQVVCKADQQMDFSLNKCIKKQTQKQQSCKHGQKRNPSSNLCEPMQTQKIQKTQISIPNFCPYGWYRDPVTTLCKRATTQPPNPACPQGQKWYPLFMKCIGTITVNGSPFYPLLQNSQQCPSGQQRNHTSGQCQPKATQIRTPTQIRTQTNKTKQINTCPSGKKWNIQLQICVPQNTVISVTPSKTTGQFLGESCPAGYKWSHLTKQCELTMQQRIQCPSGQQWHIQFNKCTDQKNLIKVQFTSLCPNGQWDQISKRCVQKRSCPSGQYWNSSHCRPIGHHYAGKSTHNTQCGLGYYWHPFLGCRQQDTQKQGITWQLNGKK